MIFSLRRKRRITAPAKTTLRTTGCNWSAVALLLVVAGSANAQSGGQLRSTFVPRDSSPPSYPVVQTQATLQVPLPKSVVPAPVAPGNMPKAPPGTDSIYVRLDPPGRERLFGSRDTERQLEERMRQEAKDVGIADTVLFPPSDPLTNEVYQPRQFAPMVAIAEPSYIVYGRLFFEEKNTERNAWNLGFIQPVVSTLYFYKDIVFLPHNCASDLHRKFETNAGECWPGNSLPYMCYPPELSVTGSAAEIALLIGMLAIVP